MARGRDYEYQYIDRARDAQDDWYLQRRREISEEESASAVKASGTSMNTIARKEEGARNNFPPSYTLGDFPEMILSSVQKCAWEIVQGEADVRNTIISIQQISAAIPEAELAEFFRPGGYALPILGFKKMPNAASTPIDLSEEPRKDIHLGFPYKDAKNFTGAVIHYLHEINHYIDQWYSSDAANDAQYQGKWGASYEDKLDKHPDFVPGERSRGIKQRLVLSNNRPSLTAAEQQSALPELLNSANASMIDGLISEEAVKPEDTGREKKLKEEYQKWRQKHAGVEPGKLQLMKLEYIEKVKQKLARDAKGTYKKWGTSINPDQTVSATKIEMGYVFEKQAYGFHTPGDTTGVWLKDFNKNFETKFGPYLDPYKALLSFPVFKKSESVSQPGDAHEVQADSIAKRVINGEQVSPSSITPVSPSLQSKPEENGLQTSPEFSNQLASSKSSGIPLSGDVKTEMESGLGADLSDVRVHTGSNAHNMSESINAKAFTHGSDVYFKNGNFDTNSSGGKELLAHELVHTQQQKRGVNRKIQRAIDGADADAIHDDLTPHLFRIRELKRNAVLRILSNYTAAEITDAWQNDPKISGELEVFVDSFRRVKDFDEFTVPLVATFMALTPEQRKNRIRGLTGGNIISSDNAVRILYLMQQLPSEELNEAFDLDKDHGSPTKFDYFQMAVPPAETERIKLAYAQTSWQEQQKSKDSYDLINTEVEKTAVEVRRILGIETKITGARGKKEERDYKKRARETKNEEVAPLTAINAYKEIQKLYNQSPEMEEEFGFRYPDLYAKVMENLPIEFMTSAEFGMQTVHFDEEKRTEQSQAYHFLYSFAKPYRFLYNHPEAFANIMELEGRLKTDNQELNGIRVQEEDAEPIAKKDMFPDRKEKVTRERDSNQVMRDDAIIALKEAVNPEFVPPAEQAGFDAGLDAIFTRIRMSADPMLSNFNWIYLPDNTINHPYFLAVLVNLFDDQLKEDGSKAQSTVKDQYALALEYRDKQPDVNEVIIGAALREQGTVQLAEELKDDDNLLAVYNQQRGVFDVIHDEDNWWGTVDSNNSLAIALTLVIQSGLGLTLANYIHSKKKPMGLPGADENESILIHYGFENGTYNPKLREWDKEELTSPEVNKERIKSMFGGLINDQLAAMYPHKKNKVAGWSWPRKLAAFLVHPKKSLDLLKSAAYFSEGFFVPNMKQNLVKNAHYENLDLVTVQENMGGQIYGMEFGSAESAKDQALLNIDVNENAGVATFDSPMLAIKSMNMEYPDMLFKTGPGQFIHMAARIQWPPDANSDKGSTTMFIEMLELTDLHYEDKETFFSIGKIHIDKLLVYSDKPIANYTQMNNWYKLFFSVMQFIQDILTLLMSGIQVSAQKFAPDMVEELKEPGADPRLQNPEKVLSNFLMQRLSEDQTISIGYMGLKIEEMFFSDMGYIQSFETDQASIRATNYEVGESGEREMFFAFDGSGLMINGADMNDTVEANKLGAGTFGIEMFFSDPSGGKLNGRDQAGALNFSQLTSVDQFSGLSKLKRMRFSLTGMSGDMLELIGFKMDTLPFTGVEGTVEFIDEVKEAENVTAKPPMAKITLDSVTGANFLGLPYPADMSLRLVSGPDSKLQGDIRDAVIMLTLNSEDDQIKNGWDIQKVEIVKLTIPELTGNNFSIITQGTETKVGQGGKILGVNLTNFVMLPNKKDHDEWDVTSLTLATGGVDMQGIGITTAAGVTADLHKFTAGSLSFGMLVTQQDVKGDTQQTTSYTFGAEGVTTTGHISYTSPQDVYDPSKKPITVGADLTMQNNTLGGTYTSTTLNDVTTGSAMTLKSKVELISIPYLNVTSEKMQITAPEVAGQPILLNGIETDVEVTFDAFGDATEFTIRSLIIDTTTTHGLLITNLTNNRNLVDLPDNVASSITKFYITDLKMAPRKFTQFEIDEMKRDKKRDQMPDENKAWDFNQDNKGLNRIGLVGSKFLEGMKLAIGDHIGVEMKKATSGEIYFDFVSINEYSYSITDLDAEDVTITDDGKQIFKGDLDSETATGTYKMEVIGEGLDAKKKTTITGQINIPEIKVHQLLIESDTSLIEIPADATETSTITKLVADYSVVITGPSENEKAVIKAEVEAASEELKLGKKMPKKKYDDLVKISKKEAKSEVVMTINSMTMEKLQAYGLHLKSTSETDVKRSKSPGGKHIETYETKKFEIKLRNDKAATINSLYIEDLVVTIPADDEKKVVMSATTITAGGKQDEKGNDILGIDIGTAEIVTNSVKYLLQGTQETAPKVNNNFVTTRLEVKKFTFGGSTDGEYAITIDDPKFFFPENRVGPGSPNVSSHYIEYDLDETDEGSGAPSVKKHTDTDILLKSLQNGDTPVLSAKSVVIKRQIIKENGLPKLDENKEQMFEHVIEVVDPILDTIKIKHDFNNNQSGQIHDVEVSLSGDLTGTTLILEPGNENFDEIQDKNPLLRKTSPAYVLRPKDPTAALVFKNIEVVVNWNQKDELKPDANNTDLPENDWDPVALAGYEATGKFDFLDGATGTMILSLFGTDVEIDVESVPEHGAGWADVSAGIEDIENIMEGENTTVDDQGNETTTPRAENNPWLGLTDLEAEHEDNLYVLESSFWDVDIMVLVPDYDNDVLVTDDGRELVRLSSLVDYQVNKPITLKRAEPDANEIAADEDIHQILNEDFLQFGYSLDVTINMDQLTDKDAAEQAKKRGALAFLTTDEPVQMQLDGGLNQDPDNEGWRTKTLGPEFNIESFRLPPYRFTSKSEEDGKVNTVVSGDEIIVTNAKAKFANITMKKLTLTADSVSVKGFKWANKKKDK